MAENFESRIGFEATDALRDLGALAKAIDVYTAALKANPKAARQFSKANSFEEALKAQNKILKTTVTNLKTLAAQEKQTARASQEAANQTKRAAEVRSQAQKLQRRQQANLVRGQILGRAQLPGADPRAVAALDAAIAKIQKLVTVSGTSAKRVQAINNNLGKSYEGTSRRIRNALIQVEASLNRINKGTRGTVAGFGALQTQLGSTLTAFIRYRVVSGIFIAIERQIRESITTAKELELRLAEIQTISPEFQIRGLDEVQDQVQRISEAFGIDQLEVAAGLYQTLSNQIGNANQSLAFLSDAAEFGRATITSLSDSVDLLSGILNAYGLEASNAARVSDILFKTIELGRVKGEDLAANFGNIITQAARLGIALEEVNASVATITIQGVKADTAITGLQNIFIKLIRPSEGLKKALDEVGIFSIRAAIATDGLIGFLSKLEQTTDGTIEELGELFPRVRALRGELGLMADEGRKATETFEKLKKEFEGASGAAAGIVLETQAAQLEKNLKTIENAFTTEIGRPLIATINQVIAALGGADIVAAQLTSTIRTLGPVATVAFGLIAGQQLIKLIGLMSKGTLVARGLTLAISALGGPLFAAAAVGAAALVFALTRSKDFASELQGELEELQTTTQKVIREINKTQTASINANKVAIQAATKDIIVDLRKREIAFRKNRDSAISFQEQVTDSLKDQLQERLSLVNRLVNAVVKAQETARKNIAGLAQGQIDFEFEINQGRFERNLRGLKSPARQARELARRSNELINAARRAEDPQFSQRLIEQAANAAERAADIAGQRRIGEQQINRVLKARQSLNTRLIAQEQEKANAAAKQEVAIREQAITLRRDIDTFNTKAKEITKGTKDGDFTEAEVIRRRKELEALGTSIRAELDAIGKSGLDVLLGQSQALRLLSDPFRDPLSGKQVELEFAIGNSVDQLLAALKKQISEVPIPIKLAIESVTGVELGIKGFTQVIDKIAQVSQGAQKAQDNSREFSAAQQQLAAANIAVTKSADQLVKSFQEFSIDKAASLLQGLTDTNFEPAESGVLLLAKALKNVRDEIKAIVTSGDLSGLEEIQTKLEGFKDTTADSTFFGGDLTQQSQIAGVLVSQLDALISAQETLTEQRKNLTEGQQQATGLGLLQQALGDPSVVKDANTALAATNTAFKLLSTTGFSAGLTLENAIDRAAAAQSALKLSIDATTAALKRQEAASTNGGTTQNQAAGGPVRFFGDGGFTPRGTDTVPAMLTPGETVVGAANSRRFFSELAAINAGKPPIFRQEGGSVSNTFTGDININTSAPNGILNGREAANQIRRELRRKTARL